jgi:exodeoxyribonuclease VII small subunit
MTPFNVLLKDLEKTVNNLENNEVSLEESFTLYKKGIDLAEKCYKKLTTIEKDILLVSENKQRIVEDPVTKDTITEKKGASVELPGLFENQ